MINILIGRAGTGKTTRIMEEIRDRTEHGTTHAILIVPEQYSHSAERQLLHCVGDTLSLRGEVLSFKRLAARVADERGEASATLDNGGILLTLYRALNAVNDQLRIYGGRNEARRDEFLDSLRRTVTELRTNAVTADALMTASQKKPGALGDKLHDLALITAAFDAHLPNGLSDAASSILHLSETIANSSYANYALYFDGFNDFTEPELRVLNALIRNGADITLCLTCPNLYGDEDIFRTSRDAAEDIIRYALEAGQPYRITEIAAEATTDSRRAAPLRHMESELFEPAPKPYIGDASDTIEILTAPDPVRECEYAATKVIELVQNLNSHRDCVADGNPDTPKSLRYGDIADGNPDISKSLRYGDIAVMVRGDSSTLTLCQSVFDRYGIPTFLSGRGDILEKPPVRLVTSALEIVSSSWEYDDVFTYIKTNLTGLTPDEADALENHVIRRNIRGTAWTRSAPWRDTESLDAIRQHVVEPLAALADALRDARTCGNMLHALYEFLERIDLAGTIARRADELDAAGETRLADEYAQLWDILMHALDQMHLAIADAPCSVAEFSRLLTLLLSQSDVGVIPVSLDRVMLGDMAMSRRRDIRALIVIGATDSAMPHLPEPSGVLSDAERDELITALEIPLHDTSERLLFREMNVIYSALTLPTQQLAVIHPESGGQPAFFVKQLKSIFNCTPRRMTEAEYMTAAPIPCFEFAVSPSKSPERHAAFEYFAARGELDRLTSAHNRAAAPRGTLSPETSEKLYGRSLKLSATRAEKFASCKFAFFMQNGLRAKPRHPESFDAPEVGTFTHFVLERVAATVLASPGGFKSVTDDEIRAHTRRFTDQYIAENYPDFNDKTERFRYLLRRLAKSTESIALDLSHELERSDFTPRSFETEIETRVGTDDDDLTVTGFIDRIDGWVRGDKLYLRVSDYKTGRREFNLSDVVHGLGLQMLIYIYALGKSPQTDGLSVEPAAVLYTPARDELHTAKRNEPDEKIAVELAKKLRRNGLLLFDPEVIEAMESGEEKRYLPVKLTKGILGGDALVTAEQIGILSRHVETNLIAISREVRRGSISADPYFKSDTENACIYCDFAAACAFGSLTGDAYRYLRKIPTKNVWEKLGGDA